jgi:4a-hydroxytetrahydrobiopterin dehydratase
MIRLSSEKISEELKNLPGWSIKDEKLHRDFEFETFNQAFGFMTRAAMEIEKMNHLDLMTHDAGGITQNDVELAKILNSLV